jgi:hypothetical protein
MIEKASKWEIAGISMAGLVEGIDKLLEEIDAVCYKEAEESDPGHPLRLFRTWLFGSASLWYDDDTIEFTP